MGIGQCQSVKNIIAFESQVDGRLHSTEAVLKANPNVNIFGYMDMMSLKLPKALPLCPPRPKDCAIIMYTSGSTGNPKGVLLSHENMVSAMSALINIAQFRSKDRYIAYLPLAHVLELLAESSCLMYGIKIGYSSAQTLTNKSTKVKAGSKGDANFLKPTLMCAVPLILERIYKSIVDTMRRQGWAAEELFHYFVQYKMKWQDRGFDTPLLNKTWVRKIRYFVGGRVRLMLSGGAPLSPHEAIDLKEVQDAVVKSLEKYGMKMGLLRTECPQRVFLTLDEWTPDSGLVTAAFKIRRRFIVQKYEKQINAMYGCL